MSMEESGVGLGDALQMASANGEGWGGNNILWLFALFILMGWGGNWGNRGNGNPVTESDLCNANSFSELKNEVGRMSDQQAAIARQTDNGIANLGYESLRNFNATQQASAQQASALQQQIADCCCTTQRAIDGIGTALATDTAAVNANTTAQVQKVLDALCQSKTEALQAQVNELQLQAALQGVMRYPMGTTYTAGYNPYFNQAACNCGTVF